ncbi:uncharacterized protein PFL1_05407 [Pseudozyma flocculosa PF-1]|uniref:Uncharacterized protein n=2 Tax=Pseudozyma flocculosa TaxID=84751 RepID=A0A5C3FAP1_9BASI|nr:uncharacterized protein PFL1_05407 [Pseudozyma flocculosa PF-1]EPQ27126.1 hypothetical protein PFL1_05407 [Pseudozyma flocculosa PF-1]SPO41300.1 uncharacterized protein PSFLO_06782 [Pseudozyma flocculosa]
MAQQSKEEGRRLEQAYRDVLRKDKEEKEKRARKKGAKKKAKGGNARDFDTRHLGVWHTTGDRDLTFTAETLSHMDNTIPLLKWIKKHTELFCCKLKTIHQAYQEAFKTRKIGMDWVASIHETKDETPSILYNFGTPAFHVLPAYKVNVKMQPLDVVISLMSRSGSCLLDHCITA